jgi:hypothetical protein
LGIRRVEFLLGGDLFTGLSGGIQDWSSGPGAIFEFDAGHRMFLFVEQGENRPDEEFELADTLEVLAGSYDADAVMVNFSTTSAKPVSVDGTLRIGEFYGGTLRATGGSLTVTPTPQVSFTAGLNRNRVEIPSGDFTADIASLRTAFAFNTRLTTNLLVQYNSLDDAWGANFRLNFIHRPGSDLFLVITEERGRDGDLWEVSDRAMVAKITYLKRF